MHFDSYQDVLIILIKARGIPEHFKRFVVPISGLALDRDKWGGGQLNLPQSPGALPLLARKTGIRMCDRHGNLPHYYV